MEQCAVIYSMLSTLDASAAVFPNVVAAVAEGRIIVDCATLTPQRMQEMDTQVQAKGGLFLGE